MILAKLHDVRRSESLAVREILQIFTKDEPKLSRDCAKAALVHKAYLPLTGVTNVDFNSHFVSTETVHITIIDRGQNIWKFHDITS